VWEGWWVVEEEEEKEGLCEREEMEDGETITYLFISK
jgi:hypothetical protein